MLGDTIMLSSPEISIWSSAKEAYDAGNTTSGFYSIQLPGWTSPQQIYCDMVNNGGGWMLWYNRTAQAPFENTLDLRLGPSGVGHWSGWENNSAPGLITSDWTDLTTEGYIHIWPHFNGSRKIRWNSSISGKSATSPGDFGMIVLIAQENGSTFGENQVTGFPGGNTCANVNKKYIWTKIQADSGWSNSHNGSYYYSSCTGNWPNLGTGIGNYIVNTDNNTGYGTRSVLFGNGASGYYNWGSRWDYDYFDWLGRGIYNDVVPSGADRWNNQLWVQ